MNQKENEIVIRLLRFFDDPDEKTYYRINYAYVDDHVLFDTGSDLNLMVRYPTLYEDLEELYNMGYSRESIKQLLDRVAEVNFEDDPLHIARRLKIYRRILSEIQSIERQSPSLMQLLVKRFDYDRMKDFLRNMIEQLFLRLRYLNVEEGSIDVWEDHVYLKDFTNFPNIVGSDKSSRRFYVILVLFYVLNDKRFHLLSKEGIEVHHIGKTIEFLLGKNPSVEEKLHRYIFNKKRSMP